MSLTAAEAAALLGVKPATLYAYVSRGLIRSEAGSARTRERRYNAEDVRALLGKQTLRRDPASALDGAAQGAVSGVLNWGAPILDSALTCIDGSQLSYRGLDVTQLAQRATVEEIAALLWTGDLHNWSQLPLRARLHLSAHPRAALGAEAMSYALIHAGAHDVTALDLRPETLPAQAARVLSLLYAALEHHEGIPAAPDLPFHVRLARLWGVSESADLLRRALVLLADHELNVSTFAARVTASGGASLHHSALAALCALQGPKHGLAALETYDLIEHALKSGAREALRATTRRSAQLPGFGHRLYPAGDVRASNLLSALTAQWPHLPGVQATLELTEITRSETGEKPNIDLILAALIHALGRGPDDTLTLFALARSVGWLAHALETALSGQMIRPRARYTG